VRAVADPDARVSARELALGLPKHAWRTITWRDGSADPLCSRFARVRVRTAPIRAAAARPEETLLIEWPRGEAAPTKYWLSNVDRKISFRELVDIAKMRWRIERDYQDPASKSCLIHRSSCRERGAPLGQATAWTRVAEFGLRTAATHLDASLWLTSIILNSEAPRRQRT
jgi:SRSO17 transposase